MSLDFIFSVNEQFDISPMDLGLDANGVVWRKVARSQKEFTLENK